MGPRRVRGPKFRVFSLSRHSFYSFFPFLLVLFVEFWWCLKRQCAQMCTFRVLRLSCETPAGPTRPCRRGVTTREPKCAHLSAPALQTPPEFHEKTTRARNFGPPTLRSPTIRASTLRASTLRAPTFSGLGPPPFEPPFSGLGPQNTHKKREQLISKKREQLTPKNQNLCKQLKPKRQPKSVWPKSEQGVRQCHNLPSTVNNMVV